MQIESLKVYCDLAETESFTKTAQINGVTQSAISQQLSSLERQFESLLVERSKKNFQLTREGRVLYGEGRVLYDYSKQIIAMQKALHDRMLALKDIISGSIRVATIYSIGLHDLPLYITRFLKSYPSVNVHVEYRRAGQIYEDVASNVVDLGLVAYPRKDKKLETVALRKEAMVLICHPEHPFAKRKSIELKALDGQKFVSFEEEMPTRRALDKVFRARGVAVQHMMEFDNIETMKRAVEIGTGIAIVPQTTVTEEVSGGTLAAVQIAGGGLSRPLAAIYKETRVLSPAMKQFLTLLKEPN
jgi:LysR family transcriptional regulator, transcriptional activator of the cysJI operon